MNSELTILLLLASAFLALFGLAEILYHKARMRAEHTRKIVHVGTGLLTLLFPLVLDEFWQVAVLCGLFLLLLLASMRWKLLPSINAVERDTLGSLLYPVIVVAVFWVYEGPRDSLDPFGALAFFYLPILIMALCDPLAAAVGQHIAARNERWHGRKTWQGSLAFFLGALALSSIFIDTGARPAHEVFRVSFGAAFAIAVCTTLTEYWSKRGWDNFTIPAVAVFILYLSGWLRD